MKVFRYTVALVIAVVASIVVVTAGFAGGDHPEKVFVCKYVGTPGVDEVLQTGQNPISVSVNAIPEGASVGAYFTDQQGRSYVLAFDTGQPEPDVSNCPQPPPPTDVCPNLEGNQSTVPEGYVKDANGNCVPVPGDKQVVAGVTFNEATCTAGPSFTFVRTIPGLRFYNVEGPLVDGKPVAGGTYTVTALPDEGYVVVGQSVWVHTFAAAPTNCGTPQVTGNATVICVAGVYQLSGTVDGQAADKVTPATLPGNTKGVTNVEVTRGDTTVRTTVTTLGDCGVTTTTTPPPPPATTTPPPPPAATPPPPAATPPPPPPAAKPPAVKPPKKATSTAKPPKNKPPKLTGNPKTDKCVPLKGKAGKAGVMNCKGVIVTPGSG